MGLNGFNITSSKGATDDINPITAFIWTKMSASATGFKYFVTRPNEAALLSSRDLDSKISTGSDTFKTDFPDMRLAPTCFNTKSRLSFCPLIKS